MYRVGRVACALLLLLACPRDGHAQASMVPEWLAREGAVLSGTREGTVPDASALVMTPGPVAMPVAGALLLCHVEVSDAGPHGRWDSFADPDLRIQLRVGGFRSMAWGSENSMRADVSFAGVPLALRDRIEVIVWDRDVTGDERIDTLRTAFEGGFPIALDHDTTHVHCSLGDPARVESSAAAAFARAESIVTRVETARPVLIEAGLGRSPSDEDAAGAQIALGMAYVGLRDAHALALRDRLRASDVAFDRALGALVTQTLAVDGADTATLPGGATAHVEGTLANRAAIRRAYPDAPDPMPFVVEISLAPMPADLGDLLGTPDAVDARGSVITSLSVSRSATDPTRVGIAFATRLRGVVLRVGTAARALLAVH